MTKYEFKKFPILATVLTIIGLFSAVLAISISLMTYLDAIAGLALLEIVGTVLVLAGLTTGKVGLLRVISIIMTVSILIVSFALSIDKYNAHDVFLFAVSLLMLVGSVLSLVYFLTIKNQRIEKMYYVASIVMLTLVVVYAIIRCISNFSSSVCCLLVSYAAITVLPVSVYISLTKVEVPDEPLEEENQEEKQEDDNNQ